MVNGHISNKFEVFDNIMITNWTNWEYLVPTILKEYTDNESADSIYQRSHSLPEQILDNIIKIIKNTKSEKTQSSRFYIKTIILIIFLLSMT